MSKPIYLDYAATTPVDADVAACMADYLTSEGTFANPASRSHLYGWLAEEAVENARRQVADLVGADPREIVWTSGATEADNLALKGAAFARQKRGRHIVTATSEHKAVVDPAHWLEKQGFEVTWLKPDAAGVIPADAVAEALRDDTILVSVMHANNETGVINDIATLGKHCRDAGVLFHVDAAQTAGKLPIDLGELPVDLMSFSAHKIYGPKGIGALYVRRSPDVRIEAQIHGGGHERGMRSGTLATHQVVGMGEAFALAGERMKKDRERIEPLRDRLWQGLSELGDVHLNGHESQRLYGHLNVAFAHVSGEMLMTALNRIAVSSGSACTSATVEPSYVLKAMGVSDELAHASIRFSIGRYTTEDDIEQVIAHVGEVVGRLRAVSA
jgi:cysteine desulfurase